MQTPLEIIISFLDTNHIVYSTYEHEEVRTSEEAAKIRNVSMSEAGKSMVAKSKNQLYLLVLPGDMVIDWKRAKQEIGLKDLQLAPPDEAEQYTGIKMGGMSPLGNLFNLPTFFDKEILHHEYIHFNAGSKRHSITMKTSDLVTLVKPDIISFSRPKNMLP